MKKNNNVEKISIKNHKYYVVDDIINIKDFDSNNIKIDEKSCKNILIYCIAYATIKDPKYVKINSVNISYLMFNRMNGYFQEINGNRNLTLAAKDKVKIYQEMWNKIRDLIGSATKKSNDYDEKYIKFYPDHKLPLKNDRGSCYDISCYSYFYENNKYCPQ